MSATDELRRLLDERGMEHFDGCENTLWGYEQTSESTGIYRYSADEISGGFVNVWLHHCTPEQAIAATLGDADATDARQGDAGTCHDMGGCRWFRCSACGFGIEDMYVSDEDEYPPEDQPRYCPNCGRLVVEVGE